MSKSKVRRKVIIQKREDQEHPIQTEVLSVHHPGLGFFVSLFLVVATLVVFWQVRHYGFMDIDDGVYVAENTQVQYGLTLKGLVWAFTTMHASNWHPLTWLSHMLDSEFYGLSPAGHHMTNLFFHIVNTLLLFLVLKRMIGSLWGSGFIAALFALHPLHVESVVWIAERKDVLSTFFWILTMGAYVLYTERPGMSRYLLVFLCLALGLLSKPMLVTLPFVMLLLDYWPLGRLQFGLLDSHRDSPNRKPMNPRHQRSPVLYLIREKVPFFTLVAVSSFLTFYAQQSGGAVRPLELCPLDARMFNALISYVSYIGKMIWPHRLAILYPYPERFPIWQVIGAGLLLGGISFLVICAVRRYPYLLVGWLWYLGTLVPVIGLVQVGLQSMADRYTYVPLIGLFIMIAKGVPDLLAEWRYRKVVLPAAISLLLLIIMIMTRGQVSLWKSNLSLFEHTLHVTSNNSRIHNHFGYNLFQQGKTREAITHYTEALRIDPYFAMAHYNLGVALVRQGDVQGAITHYTEALEINPNHADSHNNLGIILARQGKNQEAITHFDRALRIKPEHAEIYINLANSLSELGKVEESIAFYAKALRIQADHFGAHFNLGNALVRQGKIHEAIMHYNKSLRTKPNFDEAHFNLSLAYLMIGDQTSALEEYEILKRINPELANSLSHRIFK